MTEQDDKGRVLTPADVGRMFRVDPKTVTRWANSGLLPEGFLTPGGHRRWFEADVLGAAPGVRPVR
jgi:DNA-binding transcriptional MerR regulator